jgi:hypothetical protein
LKEGHGDPAPRSDCRHPAPVARATSAPDSGIVPQLVAIKASPQEEIRTVAMERTAQGVQVPAVIKVSFLNKALVFGIFAQPTGRKRIENTAVAKKADIDEESCPVPAREEVNQVSVRANKTIPIPLEAVRRTGRDRRN